MFVVVLGSDGYGIRRGGRGEGGWAVFLLTNSLVPHGKQEYTGPRTANPAYHRSRGGRAELDALGSFGHHRLFFRAEEEGGRGKTGRPDSRGGLVLLRNGGEVHCSVGICLTSRQIAPVMLWAPLRETRRRSVLEEEADRQGAPPTAHIAAYSHSPEERLAMCAPSCYAA